MLPQFLKTPLSRCAAAFCLIVALAGQSNGAKRSKRPITKPKFDPNAAKVELFKGIKSGRIDIRVIPRDSGGGRVLFENKTKKPLTVLLPKGIVGVQVLKQLQPGGGIGGAGQPGLGQGQNLNQNQGYGQQQPFGGGFGGFGGGFGGGMGAFGGIGGFGGGLGGGGIALGGGFFSVPPERTVMIPYRSVCLAHGKPEPSLKSTYRLMKVEDYTDDKTLQKLIEIIGTKKIDEKIAQAAAWHLTDKMSWRELALKKEKHLGGAPTPYFTSAHIVYARRLVGIASGNIKEESPKTQRTPPLRRARFNR